MNHTATTELAALSLHDALPIWPHGGHRCSPMSGATRRRSATGRAKASASTGWMRPRRSEEHTSELQSHSDLVCRLLLEIKNRVAIPDKPIVLDPYKLLVKVDRN